MCNQQSLRSACAYAQSDKSLCLLLEYSMIVKLLTEHHFEFLSLKEGCRGSSESSLVKMSNCWKSHAMAQLLCFTFNFRGIGKYSWELTKLRLYANLRFTHFGFEPRSVTTHIDEHSVIVYWRLYYQNQLKFYQFWKFNPFKPAEEKFE